MPQPQQYIYPSVPINRGLYYYTNTVPVQVYKNPQTPPINPYNYNNVMIKNPTEQKFTPLIDIYSPYHLNPPPLYRQDEKSYIVNNYHDDKLENYLLEKGDIERFLEIYQYDSSSQELRKMYLRYKDMNDFKELLKNKHFNSPSGTIKLMEIIKSMDTNDEENTERVKKCITYINRFMKSNVSEDLKEYIIYCTDNLQKIDYCEHSLAKLDPSKPDIRSLRYMPLIPL